MRTRLRIAAVLAAVGALFAGTAAPAGATAAPARSWSPDLTAGEEAGVTVEAGVAHLDPAGAYVAPVEGTGAAEGTAGVPTGLLTLPSRRLPSRTDRVGTSVLADLPPGSSVTVDVRGRRDTGGWTEWVPARSGTDGRTARLPEPTDEVQSRLVLTGAAGSEPAVRALTLHAHPARPDLTEGRRGAEQVPLSYRVFATREGLVGRTTANGHVIARRDHFVALPSRRALAPRGTSDYSVRVCAANRRCAFAPVWDVGPWNTRDDYWNPRSERQQWSDLPQGLPQAQAAFSDGYNDGKDQYAREVANPAGIDLSDGLFRDALGLKSNAWVTVDYLWTGGARLGDVRSGGPVDVLAAPDAAAEVVGTAAGNAAVPVECLLSTVAGSWLRIGVDQYLDAAAVSPPGPVRACGSADGGGTRAG